MMTKLSTSHEVFISLISCWFFIHYLDKFVSINLEFFCFFARFVECLLFNAQNSSRNIQIHFTIEREGNQVIPFLDVLYTAYRTKTFMGLLTNFLSFTPFCFKMGLVKILIDRTSKINNSWLDFHNDIQDMSTILHTNLYPEHVAI